MTASVTTRRRNYDGIFFALLLILEESNKVDYFTSRKKRKPTLCPHSPTSRRRLSASAARSPGYVHSCPPPHSCSCVTCGAEAMEEEEEEEEEGKGSECACLDRGKGTADDGILNYARSCIQIRCRVTRLRLAI